MTLPLPHDAAELLAHRILGWLAEDPDRVASFAAETGADPGNLRTQAQDPEFPGFVLDFLLADEALLIECCTALSVPPDHPMRARAALSGGYLADQV